MGLIKAALGAAGGVLADQWKEFFYCDSLDKDTLVVKGQKRTSSALFQDGRLKIQLHPPRRGRETNEVTRSL